MVGYRCNIMVLRGLGVVAILARPMLFLGSGIS